MVLTSCLTGCSTFSINYVKYYNETVATVNNYNITRFELLNAFDNYGEDYFVTQQGKSKKEGVEETLNLIIERKLLEDYAKSDNHYKLSEYDINNIYQKVLDYMQESFDTHLVNARKMLDMSEIKDKEEEESEEETAYKMSGYTYKKRAELLVGDIIDYLDDSEKEEVINDYALGNKDVDVDYVTNYSSKSKNDIITKLYTKFIANAGINRYNEENYSILYHKAMNSLAKYLISYEHYLRDENGKPYSTDTPSLLKRLIGRAYDNEVQSAYIANLEDYYVENTNLSLDKLITKYKTLTETDFAKFENNTTAYYDYLKTIGTDAEMIYYTPSTAKNDEDTEFGYFLHVLLPLDEAITKNIIDVVKDGDYDEAGIKAYIAEKIANETHQRRNLETGLLEEQEIYITDILNDYKSVQSLDDFKRFMFEYTSDTATLTAKQPYVIGYNGETNYSGMVEQFTEEAVRLMKEDITMTSSEDYIVTTYGIHLLYHLGEVEARIPYEIRNAVTISRDKSLKYNLYYTYANELTKQTYFDVLFDLVYPASEGSVYASANGYTDFEKGLVERLKKDNVEIYRTKLDNTIKD